MTPPRNEAPGRAADAELEVLEVALDVHRHLELGGQLERLLERACAWTGARGGFALARAEDGRTFAPACAVWDATEPRPSALDRLGADELERAFSGRNGPVPGLAALPDVARSWPGPSPAASLLLPVHGRDAAIEAALLLLFDGAPASAALERLAALLERIRPAVGNARQVQAMRELVIKDDTAHCFNRRHFETSLPEELSRANRFGTPVSLIFLDMDNLKEVNKAHGHAMGSRTLSEVSRRIRSKIRRFDKLFRFGGDEFCIVLPETEWHGALEVAERVRDAIARQPFLQREMPEGEGIRMTASLGIASFPLHARSQRDLIELADRAMQRIKNSTKNSIGIAEILGEEDER